MQKFVLSMLWLLWSAVAMGQVPTRIQYQAIARDLQTGLELANQDVFIAFALRAGGPQGQVLYQEHHSQVLTNDFGLFSLQIGGGEPVFGTMQAVNWAAGNVWLEVDIDIGTGLQSIAAMQLVSVPYALHAQSVSNADDADADPANELITHFAFDPDSATLSISDAGGAHTVSLGLLNDDPDPTNELVTALVFDATTSLLTLDQAGGGFAVDLSVLIPDADADPTNEKISGIFFNAGSNIITITEGGQNYSTALGPIDNDTDPGNELIEPNSFQLGVDGTLSIIEAGITHSVNLSPLVPASLWAQNSGTGAVFNTANSVGIGTEDPQASLEVRATSPDATILRISANNGQVPLEVNGQRVTTGMESTLSVNGQTRFKPTILTAGSGSGNYSIESHETVVVVLRPGATSGTYTINLPNAEEVEGRLILIRAVGPGNGAVFVTGGGSNIDLSPAPYNIPPSADSGSAFYSAGTNGWIRLY